MYIKGIVCALLIGSLVTAVQAQKNETGSLKGKVESVDGKPAEFINLSLEGTNLGAVSNGAGMFEIRNIPVGTYTLQASYIGMSTQKIAVAISAGPNSIDQIVLEESSQELKEIIISGSQINEFARKETPYVARLPLSNLENPQVYSVITKELLAEQQVTDVQSALVNAPSVSNVMQGVGSGGVGLNFYLRGFSADIAMRNGIATAFRTGTDPVNLERIEVIKGPSGTLFGTSLVSSYGGVVNRVTKKPYENFGGSVGYSTGSFNLSRTTIDLNTPLNEEKTVLFRINASKHFENSFQDYGLTRNWFVAPSLTYEASDRLTLNLEAELYSNQAPVTFFNPVGAGMSSMDELHYDFEHSYGSDDLNFQSKSYNIFAEATYEISENWISQTVVSSSNVDNSTHYLFLDFIDAYDARRRIMNIESQFNVLDIQQNFTGRFNIGALKNKLLVGVDYNDVQTPYRRTQVYYDTIGFDNPQPDFNPEAYRNMIAQTSAFLVGTRDQTSLGIYASDVVNITSKLSVMASLRYDHFNNAEEDYQQSYLAPKFGVVYQVVDQQVTLFANYMNGFKNVAPDLSSGEKVELDPEYATQVEGGVKTELFNGKINTTLSYYDITVKDAVRYVNTGGVWSQVQDGVKSSKGFEVEMIANPVTGWNLVGGYGYNKSEFEEGDESVLGNAPYATPRHTFNLWTSYKLSVSALKGLGLGFGVNHISESYVDDANTLLAPGYTLLNGSVFYDRPAFRVGVKCNNLTDEEYWANQGSYVQPQKTRNTVISFTYKF